MFHPFRKAKSPSAEDDGVIIVKQTPPNVCGGTDATQDTRAPQVITSQEMILFDVTSALGGCVQAGEEEADRLDYVSAFAAPAGKGTFLFLQKQTVPHRFGERSSEWALVEEDVFPALVDLVNACDLAKGNGYHSTTHGLPENFGGHVRAHYAGGETISYSNNQTPVLSQLAAGRIVALFEKTMSGERVPLPDVEDLCSVRFDEERPDGGFTHSLLTLLSDGTGTNAKRQKFDDPTVYESEKPVDADTVAAIKRTITANGMLAWTGLPDNGFARREKKTLTFTFADGTAVTVPEGLALPGDLRGGFFSIELELTTKH